MCCSKSTTELAPMLVMCGHQFFRFRAGSGPSGFSLVVYSFNGSVLSVYVVSKFIRSVSIQYVAFLEIFEEESEQREGDMIHFTCLPELRQFLQFDF